MAHGVTEEYRVETNSGGTGWAPEGDHRTFPTREAAERFMGERADWYGDPVRHQHRVRVRTVTPWMEVPRAQHLTSIEQRPVSGEGTPTAFRFTAVCSCGWRGTGFRNDELSASDEATAHLLEVQS